MFKDWSVVVVSWHAADPKCNMRYEVFADVDVDYDCDDNNNINRDGGDDGGGGCNCGEGIYHSTDFD